MKYKLFFLLILFQTALSSISAQEEYRHTYRAAYDYTEINHFDKKETKDLFYLDMSPSVNRFMSARTILRDSIKIAGIKAKKDIYEVLNEAKKYPKGEKETIYLDIRNRTHIVNSFFMDYFRYKEPQPQIQWEKTETPKEVMGYPCQEAKTKLYGREWVVYYTEEIPMPYGPWKLGGLPGLITEAYTTDSCYHFTITGFEHRNTKDEIHIPLKATVIEPSDFIHYSRKEYLEMRYTHRTDPETLKKKSGFKTDYKPDPVIYQNYQKHQKERYQYIEKE